MGTLADRERNDGNRVVSRHTARILATSLAVALCVASAGCSSVRPPRGVKPVERVMLTTGYCPCGKCCGWRRNWLLRPVYKSGPNKGKRKSVGVTASGKRARQGITIAADTRRYPFGTIMHVPGWGYGRVEDTGAAIQGNHIDLYFNRHHEAMRWGKRKLTIRIWRAR